MAKRRNAAAPAVEQAPPVASAVPSMLEEIIGAINAGSGGLVGSDAEMLYLDVLKSVREKLEAIDLPALIAGLAALEVLRGEHAGALDTIATRDMRIKELETAAAAVVQAAAAATRPAGTCAKCSNADHAGAEPCVCACHVPIETRYQKVAELIEELVASPEAAVVDRAKLREAIKTGLDDLSGIVR